MPIENSFIVYLNLKAEGVKENFYRIKSFEIVDNELFMVNLDHLSETILDSNGGLTTNIYNP
jgi:hypothetical protein